LSSFAVMPASSGDCSFRFIFRLQSFAILDMFNLVQEKRKVNENETRKTMHK